MTSAVKTLLVTLGKSLLWAVAKVLGIGSSECSCGCNDTAEPPAQVNEEDNNAQQ